MIVKEQHGKTRVLRLARPPANVLNRTLLDSLRREIEEAGRAPDVRCLLLASAYPRYFSAGLDLEELLSLAPERRPELFGSLVETHQALRGLAKPSLAAIGGSAILGGWILAMGCDFRLLTAGTGKIALSEVRMGLSPGAGLIAALSDLSSSPSLVKDMVLRGRTLRADEALAGGFVDRLVAPEALEDEALKEARHLCKLPLEAYASIKRSLSRRTPEQEAELWRQSYDDLARLLAGPEGREGVVAMKEKRRARFPGAEHSEE